VAPSGSTASSKAATLAYVEERVDADGGLVAASVGAGCRGSSDSDYQRPDMERAPEQSSWLDGPEARGPGGYGEFASAR